MMKNSVLFKTIQFAVFLSFLLNANIPCQAQVMLTSTGTNNAFSVQYPANIQGLSPGLMVTFFSNQSISGASTLSLNSTGPVNIFKNVSQPLASGDILIGQPVTVIFDGTNWQLLSTSANTPNSNLWTVSGTNIFPANISNSVGIGTGLPQNTLHVVGGTRIANLSTGGAVFSNTNGDLYIGSIGGILGSGTPGGVAFWSGNSTLTANGANLYWSNTLPGLGIGTSSPSSPLSIVGSEGTLNGLRASILLMNLSATSPAGSQWHIRAGGNGTVTPNGGISMGDGYGYWLSILSGFNGGWVGINTTTPTAQLDVNGTARIRNLSLSTASSGLSLVQTDSQGNLSTTTSASFYLWTLSGTNIQPVNSSYNINLSSITGVYNIAGNPVIQQVEPNSIFVGGAGNSTTSGIQNVFFGNKSGYSNTTGFNNSFLGWQSGTSNNTGYGNAFFGLQSGQANTTGFQNVFVGVGSGFSNQTGQYNTFVGWGSGYDNTSTSNTFIGYNAGNTNTTGNGNIAIGYQSGMTAGTFANAIAIGSNAQVGGSNMMVLGGTGTSTVNVGIGLTAPAYPLDVNGVINTRIGMQGGVFISGSRFLWGDGSDIFLGVGSNNPNSTGVQNTYIGAGAGHSNTSGWDNTFIGFNAGSLNTTGSWNTFCGNGSGNNNTTGQTNAFFGFNAGYFNTAGSGNVFMGYYAGGQNSAIIPGNNNTYIGTNATAVLTGLNNAIAIGYNATVGGSNMMSLGNGVAVGIGTGTPAANLQVMGNVGSVLIGDPGCGAGYGGISVQGVMSSCTNYSLAGAGSDLLINRPAGGAMRFRMDNGDQMTLLASGNLGIGTQTPLYTLQVAGSICYSGTILACSDLRYKKNVTPIASVLKDISGISGVYYYWKIKEFPDMKFDSTRQIGVIAQELEKVYPELVNTDFKGYKTVDYPKLGPILLQAIKEQQSIIDMQNTKINQLEKFKSSTENELERLKSALISLEERVNGKASSK